MAKKEKIKLSENIKVKGCEEALRKGYLSLQEDYKIEIESLELIPSEDGETIEASIVFKPLYSIKDAAHIIVLEGGDGFNQLQNL